MFVTNQSQKNKMKNLIIFLSGIIFISIIFYPNITNSNGNGSPGGKTGSIGDNGVSCTACHYAGNGNGANITTNIPTSGYVPGQTYTVTASIQQNGISKFGFELTAEDENGQKKGTFNITNTVETKLTNNGSAVTHKGTGTSGQSIKTWTFDWTAPGFATSTGYVKFWGSFLAANGDFTNSGDIYHFDTTSYSEEQTNSLFEINNEISTNGNKIYFNKNISKVLIYNISGKLVKHKNNFNNNFIDLSELNSAFYIVKAVDINENYTTKKIFLNQ